jgi:hypothetical protein
MLLNRYIRRRMRIARTVVLRYDPLTVRCNECFHTWCPKPDPGEKKLKNMWYACPRGCSDKYLEEDTNRKDARSPFPKARRYW